MTPDPSPIGLPLGMAPAVALVVVLAGPPPSSLAVAVAVDPPEEGIATMNEPGRQPLLAYYFDRLERDGDLDTFLDLVKPRYTEGTLRRLVHAPDVRVRRAAVTALGQLGGFGCNPELASRLADPDPVVRDLARNALWSVWFRADSPENNERLRTVIDLLGHGRLDAASRAATELIARAPNFAEAYNQRAVAAYLLGNYAESAADCRRVLELNPYHIGALGGLAQCYLQLDRPDLALPVFKRSLELQPHDDGLRRLIASLEGPPRLPPAGPPARPSPPRDASPNDPSAD
ncbi:HEAT repeat domain-containing protein [Tautonia sociabilis]|uniref:Tetratricopeptide repeat protein n=1 Tax=Tautonia sociabilis TaxID=2080755 RepID=A0A432MPA0_9BACT|nr:tetratricopeptide repeat protein [Tautonia sociabilis]RUL89283.1 tetratricopeptide repeat protein [Tautonia sociabilis]